jgi:cobalt-precorrin-5B (C1)-methyltransferase
VLSGAAFGASATAERGQGREPGVREVEIPFPDGSRHAFRIERARHEEAEGAAWASVIKDAGDDPDVTHGVEIVARVIFRGAGEGYAAPGEEGLPRVVIKGGEGVGVVTRPGLPLAVGEAAINPGPRAMVHGAVMEALTGGPVPPRPMPAGIEVTISVPRGASLAGKTLNSRLGIVGGISILGTSGIVRPLSSEAWTATIAASMSVARAMGGKEIVLCAGRSSEAAHMARYALPEETYVMMGDYVEYALLEAARHGFDRVHLCAQWAKMLKIAMAIPQTHVSHGVIDPARAAAFLGDLGFPDLKGREFTTAREMFELIADGPGGARRPVFSRVCAAARDFAESITRGVPVSVYLVSYKKEVMA